MGGVGNGAAEEDSSRGLNPGAATIRIFLGPLGLGREEPWTSISFSEIRYPGLGRGGRKDCAFVGLLKEFGISMKTLSYYS